MAAKAITTSKVDSGTITKEPVKEEEKEEEQKESAPKRALNRASEIVSNDAGELELSDFQYFAFNLLALVYFFVAFVSDPSGVGAVAGTEDIPAGLPDIPETWSGSQPRPRPATWDERGSRRGREPSRSISVVPTKIVLGETKALVIAGSDFIGETVAKPIDGKPKNAVMLDGIVLHSSDGWTDEVVTAKLEGSAEAGVRANPRADLVVRNHAGRVSESDQGSDRRQPRVAAAHPMRLAG